MLVLRLAEAARRHDQGTITRVLRALVEHEDKKKRGSIAVVSQFDLRVHETRPAG